MTIRQLWEIVTHLVAEGHGDAPVLFDTEAQTYHYHMAQVDFAHYGEEPQPHLALGENTPHHTCGPDCPERNGDGDL